MKYLATLLVVALGLSALPATPIHAQIVLPPDPGEFGDAPEGAIAYPSLGIGGLFPTCRGGPASVIYHANQLPLLWFGVSMDPEPDGNAGICPQPPYELDECYGPADNDGGLVNVSIYTINQNQVVLCSPGPDDAVGPACGTVQWGPDIDIRITNFSGNDALLNVLFDWNQDGMWGGSALGCAGGQRPEHVVVNLPVPDGYVGNLSGLNPPQLLIGPNEGYVWCRFTIGDPIPVSADWDGSFLYDTGETEDYLLLIDPEGQANAGELGDAPEDVTAYPDGTKGNFPTCIGGPVAHIFHAAPITGWFGPDVDLEGNGNHDDCVFANYENDECDGNDGDGGLIMPASFDFNGSAIMRCSDNALPNLGDPCNDVAWGVNIDIRIDNSAGGDKYLNVLADWDGSGDWGQFVTCPDATRTGSERIVVDATVPAGFVGAASTLGLPSTGILSDVGYVWFRFTLSDSPVGPDDWTGDGQFGDGETEDYLLAVGELTDVPQTIRTGARLEVLPATPNPFNPTVKIRYVMAEGGGVRVVIHDAAGRHVRTLEQGARSEGLQEVTWDGRDDDGRQLESGVYLVLVESAGFTASQKVVMLK